MCGVELSSDVRGIAQDTKSHSPLDSDLLDEPSRDKSAGYDQSAVQH